MIPSLNGIEAVTFDLDGTLAEVTWRRIRLWRGFLSHPRILGSFQPAFEALRGSRHKDLHIEVVNRIETKTKINRDRIDKVIRDQIGTQWPEMFHDAPCPPSVQKLVDRCDELHIPRAVVSDYPSLKKLELMGLTGWSAVVDCHTLGALKPLPDCLWAAMAQLGVPPARLLHVGDRWDTDGQAAAAVGCHFVHISQLE